MFRVASVIELLGVVLVSFGLNMIPFAGPSNVFIASNAALLVSADPLGIGLLVALGSTSAKLVHYTISFFVGKHVGEQRRKRLDATAVKLRRWAFAAVFIVAATPVPDDPVIIPLGLMKYSPAKFTLAYFAGKLTIGILGAYLGELSGEFLSGYVTQEVLMVISIALTIAITIVLLKVDVSGIAKRILKRTRPSKDGERTGENIN